MRVFGTADYVFVGVLGVLFAATRKILFIDKEAEDLSGLFMGLIQLELNRR